MSNNDFKEDKELWRSIKGYEGYYEVSNFGQVRSLDRTLERKNQSTIFCKGKILKLHINKQGYYYTDLKKNGKRKKERINRLVAIAFIPNPKNKPQVNHINGIKTDNRAENLEWNTPKENISHAYDNGLRKTGEKHHNAKLTNEQVREIRKSYVYGSKEFSQYALAKKYGVSQDIIKKIVHNKSYKE